ncbi:LuxR C-terminal-related transcriptional regulator [Streptomyces murinus]|uniref:LuxR C-terminal-related transcriptional regulator n=1 Tax=Streptomyces murinus TaxID=33900 RepID=UPI0021157B6C|nr:response regulator transcription factor [Streptomyces murinus]
MSPHPVRVAVAVVSDCPLLRRGLEQVIDTAPDLRRVASGKGSEEWDYETGAADVVLVNLQSPLEDVARLIARLRQQGQAAVILSASETQTELFFFIEAGASGYLSRRSGEVELLAAVRAVASGDIYFSTRLRDQSLREQRTRITHRERQILQLIANGATDREIAAKLNISEHTVHTHLDRLRGKTGCHRRADLVRLALLRDGAGEPPG